MNVCLGVRGVPAVTANDAVRALREHMSPEKAGPAGFEPAFSLHAGGRVNHCATGPIATA